MSSNGVVKETDDVCGITGSISPLRVSSPVIAVSDLTQRLVYSEHSATAIAIPADGPSLPIAPAGK